MFFEEDGHISLPLMSVADAARYLGVGRKVVYQLIEWGELHAVRDKGAVQIEKSSLDRFKASGKLT